MIKKKKNPNFAPFLTQHLEIKQVKKSYSGHFISYETLFQEDSHATLDS